MLASARWLSIDKVVSTVLPNMSTDINILCLSQVLDSDLMLSAGLTLTVEVVVCIDGIFVHQEVVEVPAEGVLIDLCPGEVEDK